MYIIQDRNKQYILSANTKIRIDLLKKNIGSIIKFNDELDKNTSLEFKILKHIKSKKYSAIKFKRRKNYIRDKYYRKFYTIIQHINTISKKES